MKTYYTLKWHWSQDKLGTVTHCGNQIRVNLDEPGRNLFERMGDGTVKEAAKIIRKLVKEWDHKYSSVEHLDSGLILEKQ